jgi:hypothetical protein
MQLRLLVFLLFIQTTSSFSQISPVRYLENFDGVSAPALPSGWGGIGFVTYASSPRSSPNCISATGNRSQKTLLSPVFNFGSHLPDKLLFWERRTSTAAAYRVEIRASIDGINFGIVLAKYDTIAAISSYVQRAIDISNMGLNYQSWVQFQWILLADSVNNTGVLRIDDVSLSVATGFDIGISEITLTPLQAARNAPITLSAFVKNYGALASSSFSVRFLCDENAHDPAESLEQFSVLHGLSLTLSDSFLCRITYIPLKGGEHHFAALVDYPSDENHSNDTAYATVHIGNIKRDLLINEIMYDPLHDQNEWFELINWSDQPVDLAHWTFHDAPTLNGVNSFEVSTQPFVVECGGYAIVAADSSIFKLYPDLSQSDPTIPIRVLNRSSGFSFNNDGDAIVLKDLTGQTIDSVAYEPRWHHPDVVDTKGRSLERINPNIDSNDPRDWSTCTNIFGGTPGKANSIVTTSKKRNSLISISPNPFSPDGDGFEDFCIIRYALPVITSTLNIRIYDIKGRLVRALASGELAGPQGEIVWDGNDDNKQRTRIGLYVIFLEATDNSSGNVTTAKAVAVVAAKL